MTRARVVKVAAEAGMTALLAGVLVVASLGLIALQYGRWPQLRPADLLTVGICGAIVAVVVRVVVRLHRRWKRVFGARTAAAGLCAVMALTGAALVHLSPRCPGSAFDTGRCDVQATAAWGLIFGLVTVLGFLAVGLSLAFGRTVASTVGDAAQQGAGWIRALASRRRMPAPARDRTKGRPTPRQADVRQARRERLSARR